VDLIKVSKRAYVRDHKELGYFYYQLAFYVFEGDDDALLSSSNIDKAFLMFYAAKALGFPEAFDYVAIFVKNGLYPNTNLL